MRVPIPKWLNDLIEIVFGIWIFFVTAVFAIKGDGIGQVIGIIVCVFFIYVVFFVRKNELD